MVNGFMKKTVFKFVLFALFSSIIFSCCKTADKKIKEDEQTEENVVREITPEKNHSSKISDSKENQNPQKNIEPVNSVASANPAEKVEPDKNPDFAEIELTVPEKINASYKNMIQEMKVGTTYSAAYTVETLSKFEFPWMDSLVDDGKYFYAIGYSKLCGGKKSAGDFAKIDAAKNLKKAAVEVTGNENIDVRLWEVF